MSFKKFKRPYVIIEEEKGGPPRRRKVRPLPRGGTARPLLAALPSWRNVGIPRYWRGRLRYSDIYAWTTAGGLDRQVYAGNGLYDPDITGIGHQPTGFDQLVAIWSRYRVYSSRIRVDVVNVAGVPVQVSITPQAVSTNFTSTQDATQYPGTTWKVLGGTTTSQDVVTITNRASTKNIFHVSDIKDDVAFTGNNANNPQNLWYWHVMIDNPTADALDLYTYVTIEYACEFLFPAVLQQS